MLIRSFILLTALATALAPRATANTAASRCDAYFRTLARTAPPTNRAEYDDLRKLFYAMRSHLNDVKTQAGARDPAKGPGVIEENPDGRTIRYHHREEDPRHAPLFSRERSYLLARLGETIRQLDNHVEAEPQDRPFRLFHTQSYRDLIKLFTTDEVLGEVKSKEHRYARLAFRCLLMGAVAGVAHAVYRNVTIDPNGQLDDEIVEKAKQTTVYTMDTHLAKLEEAVKGNDTAEIALYRHRNRLRQMQRLSVAPEYGARFSDYEGLGAKSWDDRTFQDEFEALANRGAFPGREALARDFRSYEHYRGDEVFYRGSKPAFLAEEMRHKADKGISDLHLVLPGLARLAWEGAAGAALAYAACGPLGGKLSSAFRSPRRVGKDQPTAIASGFEDVYRRIRDLQLATLPRETPMEYLWLGATVNKTGEHADILVQIAAPERFPGPPTITLSGIVHRMPVNYVVAEIPGENTVGKPSPKLLGLTELREKLVVEKFPALFGAQLKPLEEVFTVAESLQLTPDELGEFALELHGVNRLSDLKPVNDFLKDLVVARRKTRGGAP